MKILKYFSIILLASLLGYGCSEDDKIAPSGEALFPERDITPLSLELDEMFGRYNTRVEYRYIRNLLPDDWYYITPAEEGKVLPVARVFLNMWIGSLIAGSDTAFVEKHFPRMIVLIGSPAYQLDETIVLGQAEGGTLIRFTDINSFTAGDTSWVQTQLNTAFHEYAHIMHQTFNMPNTYRNVTPNEYTQNGWQPLTSNQAIMKGMVTPYGTSNVQEDFAEVFATYVMKNDALIRVLFEGGEITIDQEAYDQLTDEEKVAAQLQRKQMEAGCQLIKKKFDIMYKHLLAAGLDMAKVRAEFQRQLKIFKQK